MKGETESIYSALKKTIGFAAGAIIFLWLLFKIYTIVLLLLFAIIMALVINAPVTWLEKKNLKRGVASLIVFGTILLIFVLLGWLVIPIINRELSNLIANIPGYATQLSKNISSWFTDYPIINAELEKGGSIFFSWLPNMPNTLLSIGNYSLSILGMILVFILFLSMVVYIVLQPKPLLEIYLSFFSADNKDNAVRAMAKTSVMLVGWMKSNLIGGAIQSVAIVIMLIILKVPGAFVWGAFAFFAQLIPKLGFYLMAIPPIIVALSISTTTALWLIAFFLLMDEIMGDFVMPKIRSNTMNVHPASILFLVLAMATAFGVMGAILATPVAAIIKAFYEEFYIKSSPPDALQDTRINAILYEKETAAKE
jgi:predicted PurR-regulated permease PerM